MRRKTVISGGFPEKAGPFLLIGQPPEEYAGKKAFFGRPVLGKGVLFCVVPALFCWPPATANE
jgi:hypothetical protein